MYIEIVQPRRRGETRRVARIRDGGHLVLSPEELERLGLTGGSLVEVRRTPDGLLVLSPDTSPSKLYVELTTECNLDCPMCMRRSWEEEGGAMSTATFRRLLEQAAELPGLETLNFSGFGEPFIHPQFFDFAALAKGAGFRLEVVTNGTRLDQEAIERLVTLRVDKLIVSVDGARSLGPRAMHRSSLATVGGALKLLNRLRFERHVSLPEVGLEFVANKANIAELPALKRLAPELGYTTILVSNLVPHTPDLADLVLYERWTTASRKRQTSVWNPLVELPLMDATARAVAVVGRLRDSGAHVRVNGANLTGGGPQCRFVAEGRLAVRWDGSVSPCLALLHAHTLFVRDHAKRVVAYHLGNIAQRRLADIWRSEEYRAFRQRVRDWRFSPCIDCGGCELRETNEEDCFGDDFPRCGECLWAAGLVQCP